MRDYRDYKLLYKYTGFLVILAATFMISFKITEWVLWAENFVAMSI